MKSKIMRKIFKCCLFSQILFLIFVHISAYSFAAAAQDSAAAIKIIQDTGNGMVLEFTMAGLYHPPVDRESISESVN